MAFKTGADEATGFKRLAGGQIEQFDRDDTVALGTPIVTPPSPIKFSAYTELADYQCTAIIGAKHGDVDGCAVLLTFNARSGALLAPHVFYNNVSFGFKNVGDEVGTAIHCYNATSQSSGGSSELIAFSIVHDPFSFPFDVCQLVVGQDYNTILRRVDDGAGYNVDVYGCDAVTSGDGGSINFYPGHLAGLLTSNGSVRCTGRWIDQTPLEVIGTLGQTSALIRAYTSPGLCSFRVLYDGAIRVASGTASEGAIQLDTDDWIKAGAANKGIICCTGSAEILIGDTTALKTVAFVRVNVDDSFTVKSQTLTCFDADWLNVQIGANAGNSFVGIREDAAVNSENVNLTGTTLVNGTLNAKKPVLNRTADYTINTSGYESGHVFTNHGASGTVIFDLPHAVVGMTYTFAVIEARTLRIHLTGSETLRIGGAITSTTGYATANTEGDSVTIVCIDSSHWVATSVIGIWLCT